MTITKSKFFIIILLGILNAISSFENELSAQENDQLFLHPHEPSSGKVNEIDGAVKNDTVTDTVHIASYDKNDKRITYSVRRKWIYGRNDRDADHQPGGIDSGASLRLQEDKNKSGASDYDVSRKNALTLEEEINVDDTSNKEWNLPNTRNLKRMLDLSLFPDTAGTAASDSIFNETSLLNIAIQNDATVSAFKTGRHFTNSAFFSLLAAEKTEQEYNWARNYYYDTTSNNQMDLTYNVKIFTIDTHGKIKGITGRILNLLP